jgi:hypothetical protein
MDAPGDRAWPRRGGRSTRFGPARRCYNCRTMRPGRRRLQPRRGSPSGPPGTLRQRPEAGLKVRREAKAARAPRVRLRENPGILAARAPAAGRAVAADEPERTRSRFRGSRGEMRQSLQTASQVAIPFVGEILRVFAAPKNTLCVLTLPNEQRLCSGARVASRRLAPGFRPPPLAHQNWGRRHGRIQVLESRHGSRAHGGTERDIPPTMSTMWQIARRAGAWALL